MVLLASVLEPCRGKTVECRRNCGGPGNQVCNVSHPALSVGESYPSERSVEVVVGSDSRDEVVYKEHTALLNCTVPTGMTR